VLAVAAPAGLSGALALGWARRRALCFVSLVGATLLTAVLIVAVAFEGFAARESVAQLLRKADGQGYASLPVYQLHTLDRSAEFYAAGRLTYGDDGQPLKFEGAFQAVEAARAGGGRALVLVPVEYVGPLTGEPSVAARVVGDNGAFALVYVSAAP
jgi:hypothetical protein